MKNQKKNTTGPYFHFFSFENSETFQKNRKKVYSNFNPHEEIMAMLLRFFDEEKEEKED